MDTLLLSIVTFVPAMAALILLVVARGEDAAAGLVAKRFALVATTEHLSFRCSFYGSLIRLIRAFKWWKRPIGFWV